VGRALTWPRALLALLEGEIYLLGKFRLHTSGSFRFADQPERTRKTGTSKLNRDEGSDRLDYFRVAGHPRRFAGL
jgi:hypothetical protein